MPEDRNDPLNPKPSGFLKTLSARPETIPAIGFFLLAVTIAAYFPVWTFDYVNFDDPEYILTNRHVLAGVTLHGIAWAFLKIHASNWHPLTWISHMVDVDLFGPEAGGPHVINLLLHSANSILIFLILHRMTRAVWRSAAVATLFALHPLHVESVAWISERKDVLSTFFALVTLWFYAGYVLETNQNEKVSRNKNFWFALFFFILALLSKPMMVTLPFVLLLLDYWPLKRFENAAQAPPFATLTRLLKEKTAFFIFSAIVCILTLKAQDRAVQSTAYYTMSGRIENIFVAYAGYLGKTFWPVGLNCLYLHPGSWPLPKVLWTGLIITALCVFVLGLRPRFPFVFMGWCWFLGTLVPVIGLVQVGFQYMADRYMYLPSIGIFIILAWGAGELVSRWQKIALPIWAMAAASFAICGILTQQQLQYWKNGETLFRHTIATNAAQNNYIAYNNLGAYLAHQGIFGEAIIQYDKALQIKPDFELGSRNLGIALIHAKRYDEAIQCYQNRLRQNPTNSADYCNLGFAQTAEGKLDDALASYQKALQIKPDLEEAMINIAGVQVAKGDLNSAVTQYCKALILAPADAEVHFELGGVLKQLGRADEAGREFRTALDINPNYTLARDALDSLGKQ